MVDKGHLLRFMEGDNDALSIGFIRELPKLIFYAYSFVKDHDIASDLTAEVFEKILKYSVEERKEKLNADPEYFKNLVYLIVKNKCLDYLRLQKNRQRIIEGQSSLSTKKSTNLVEDTFVNEAFEKLLSSLGARQKEILALYVDGYSSREIATQLGISVNTVQNTLANSKRRVIALWDDFFK